MASSSAAGTRTISPEPRGGVRPTVWHSIVSIDGERAAPRVVRVRLRTTSVPRYHQLDDETCAAFARELQSGLWWGVVPWLSRTSAAGSLRLRWGSSPGIFRDVFIDLAEGEFNLSPCEHVEIAACYWDPRAQPTAEEGPLFRPSLEVSVEICEGESIESTPMILTASCALYDGESERSSAFPWWKAGTYPPGAYAVDGYAGKPGLVMLDSVNAADGLYLERGVVSGRWIPPTSPVLVGKSRDFWVTPANAGEIIAKLWKPTLTFFMR